MHKIGFETRMEFSRSRTVQYLHFLIHFCQIVCTRFFYFCPYVYFGDCMEGLPMRFYQRHDIATSSSIGYGDSFLKAARGNPWETPIG